ncbi:MAG: hypothetical protein V4555_15740 [Acidobacteriota bacterium]
MSPLLDVHPPHESVHGWRDFLLHLTTITIGLFIALSLEGLVEWQHHRHLVREAEASLHDEIKSNASGIDTVLADLHQKQQNLQKDVAILKVVAATGKFPTDKDMSIDFRIVTFDNLSWTTAQSTGALSYMPYSLARDYAGIYAQQELLTASEQQAARDAVSAIGPFINEPKDAPPPSPEEARSMIDKIETLQGQYILVEAMMTGLSFQYKHFLQNHPD